MKKGISLEEIADMETTYHKSALQKTMRHAVHAHCVDDVVRVNEQERMLQNEFSCNLKTLPVTNQKQSGRCWIFAACNVLREITAKTLQMDDFELSQNYVAFYDKLEKINYFMESMIELKDVPFSDRTKTWLLDTGIADGGQWDMFAAIIEKYGVVPKHAMPETYQSSHTRSMNRLLNTRLRKFAMQVSKLQDEEEIQQLKKATLTTLYEFLCTCFGVPPKNFTFEYVDRHQEYHRSEEMTPKAFYDTYIAMQMKDYVSIIHAPSEDKTFLQTYTVEYLGNVAGKPIKYLNLELGAFKRCIIAQLHDQEVVWFGSDCSKFGNREEGYWDPSSFDYESAFQLQLAYDKGDRMMTRESSMGHAMVLSGVHMVDGAPQKWKIENSWGDEHAHKGYYVASDAWFDDFVYQAVVHKKYLTQKECAALETPCVVLHPWDPMGSLADEYR